MAITKEATDFMQRSLDVGRPIPGQSLTNSPEQPYNWEKPAEYTSPKEAMLYTFEILTEPETTANILINVTKGVSVIDIASIVLYQGFLEGKWNPDLMILLAEPTMYMIMALAEKAEIPYEFEAGDEYLNELSPKEQNKRLREGINYFDSIHQKGAEGVDEQAVSEEVKKKIEEVELPTTSLLEKTTTAVDDNSLLVKGEK